MWLQVEMRSRLQKQLQQLYQHQYHHHQQQQFQSCLSLGWLEMRRKWLLVAV